MISNLIFKRIVNILIVASFIIGLSVTNIAPVKANTEELDMNIIKSILMSKEATTYSVRKHIDNLRTYVISVYKDVKPNDWYTENFVKLVSMGGIKGYPDGTFRGNKSITVAEFLAMLLSSNGHKQEGGKNLWYENYITKAIELGVIDKGETFDYSQGITRAQMAKMICKICKVEKLEEENYFNDTSNVESSWINSTFKNYLIRGYFDKNTKVRNFMPDKILSRAEAAMIVMDTVHYNDNDREFKFDKIVSAYNSERNIYIEKYKNEIESGEMQVSEMFVTPVPEKSKYIYKFIRSRRPNDFKMGFHLLYEHEGREEQRQMIRDILIQHFSQDDVEMAIMRMDQKKEADQWFPEKTIYSKDKLFSCIILLDDGYGGDLIGLEMRIDVRKLLK